MCSASAGFGEAEFGELDPGGGARGFVEKVAEDGAEAIGIETAGGGDVGGQGEGVGAGCVEAEVLVAALGEGAGAAEGLAPKRAPRRPRNSMRSRRR